MNIYARTVNALTFGGVKLAPGNNEVSLDDYAAMKADPALAKAVLAREVQLPEGVVLRGPETDTKTDDTPRAPRKPRAEAE